jgi:hypothetical protein
MDPKMIDLGNLLHQEGPFEPLGDGLNIDLANSHKREHLLDGKKGADTSRPWLPCRSRGYSPDS